MSKKTAKKLPEVVVEIRETPEEEQARRKDDFERHLVSQLAGACETIERFSRELIEHPLHALEWSQGAFEAGGDLEVARQVLASFNAGTDIKAIHAYCVEKAIDGANSPQFSSSTASNLTSMFVTRAWADMAKSIKLYGFLGVA